ncbi:ABC transporter permease [Candidatus Cloacimonadota bacterium]
MIKNYLKLAFRNIFRHKIFSTINILGLAIGMSVCFLVIFWMENEFSFDKFNENFNNIYRVAQIVNYEDQTIRSSKVPHPLGAVLKEEFPEVLEYTRFGTFVGEVLIRNGDRAFYELGGSYVDPGFFQIFTVPLITGDPENIFPDRYSVVISQTMAEKYFGREDPLGNSLYLENFCELTVTGVYKDIPANSHLQTDFMVPFILYEAWGSDLSSWESWDDYTYILLNPSASHLELSSKIKDLKVRFIPENRDELFLQKLRDIHLYSDLAYDSPAVLGDIDNVYTFGSIALVILILACINFINLTTARSLKRTKEVGMRKVMGAQKKDLIHQFLGETILMSFFAFLVSLVLAELLLPIFNQFTGKQLVLSLLKLDHMLKFVVLIVLTGIISGGYPAFFLSSFKPIKILQNRFKIGSGQGGFKVVLIVVQFIIAITLLISTLIIHDQLNFIQQKKLGFNKDHIIRIQSRPGMYRQYPVFKEELLKEPSVLNVTATDVLEVPFNIPADQLDWEGKNINENKTITGMQVDFDYIETLQIEMIQGRSFSSEIPNDAQLAVILNESAVEVMGLEDPLETDITLSGEQMKVIGVMKDYHANSLKVPIRPMIMSINKQVPVYIYVKIDPSDLKRTLKLIETEWYKIVPDFPYEFNFLDEMLHNIYLNERKMGSIFFSFNLLAIFISSLGLYGLTSFSAEVRTKEIGIRKVMGARMTNILWLLSRQFSKLVLIANFVAWPLAYFLAGLWLQSFAYKVEINILIFLSAGLGTLLIALAAISYQTVKAAMSDPAKALKYE